MAVLSPELPPQLSERTRSTSTLQLRVRGAVVVGIVIVVHWTAMRYTLAELSAGVDITSPVIFVPFVPLAAFACATQRWRGTPKEGSRVAHRSADWITAAALFVLALIMTIGLPQVFTTDTLTWRADLATVPVVCALVVTVLFGLRMLWRLRTVIWMLTLMSPALYRPLISPIRIGTSTSTSWGVWVLAHILPFIKETEGLVDGRRVLISNASGDISLKVAEVCAGNGAVLAGVFVSITMWMLCEAPNRTKARWSVACIVICWLGNLARLAAIFAGTSWMGEKVATGWFHESAGLMTLLLSLILSLALAGRMGINPRQKATGAPNSLVLPQVNWLTAIAVVAMIAVLAPRAHAATTDFNLLDGRSQTPSTSVSDVLTGWSVGNGPPGVGIARLEDVRWATQYFGDRATWQSYLVGTPMASGPIAVDVIASDEPSRFDTYGLSACFGFHGWRMTLNQVIDLPGDRRGEHIIYEVAGEAAQLQAKTPEGVQRSVEVVSWRQVRPDGQVERVTLHQDIAAGDPATLTQLADLIIASVDNDTSTAARSAGTTSTGARSSGGDN